MERNHVNCLLAYWRVAVVTSSAQVAMSIARSRNAVISRQPRICRAVPPARSRAARTSSKAPPPRRASTEAAILNANYLKARVGEAYGIPFERACKHEFVASAADLKKRTGVRTLDVAKRLIDKGFHPPTIYFPLTVEEGMLIEPTETESIETLDAFADALLEIAREAETDPALVTGAPHEAPVRRLDEATAARQPNLRWRGMTGAQTPCPD